MKSVKKLSLNVFKIIKLIWSFSLEIIFPRDFDVEKLESNLAGVEKWKVFESCHYLFNYKNKIIKDAIWEMKFRSNKKIAEIFGKVLAENAAELLNSNEEILLVPIPIHKKRRDDRGFNQCEWLCKELIKNINQPDSKKPKIIYNPKILIRKRYTIKQSWSNKHERQENLKGIFEIRKNCSKQIKGQKIILLDDVVTTGSTIKEARRTLSESGASQIISIVIAH